jgi:hypothetical protein|tara:strand:- start:138 stop:1016 length:879 start_codon:yes stop_codon:yes gene_type:complete
MQRFFKYIISLFTLTILLLYLCDFTYTQIYLKSNSRNKLQYILKTKNSNFDVVFLGSSRVANHINTHLFDSLSNKKTVNMGVEGAGLNDNLLQLKLLIANNHISNIFLQIDSNFEYDKPSNISISEAMPFIKNEIINNHINKYFSDFKKLEYIPFYRYAINDPKIGFREVFFSIINKKPRTNPSIGFTPITGNKRPLIDGRLPNSIGSRNIILNEIINICHKKNIKLVLFTSPYCSKTKNLNYINKLKINIPSLIDLTKNYDDSLFYNCGHLNSKGANIFTINLYNATKDKI